MDTASTSVLGPILTFFGGVIASAITAYTTIQVARLKAGEEKFAEEETLPAPRPRSRKTETPAAGSPTPNTQVKVGIGVLLAMPVVLGVEYFLLSQSFPDTWLALVITAVTAFVFMLLAVLLGVSSPKDVLDQVSALRSWSARPTAGLLLFVGLLIGFCLNVIFISLYDRGYFPLTKQGAVQRFGKPERDLNKKFRNDTRSAIIVTVSAFRSIEGPGNTMCAAIADDPAKLKAPTSPPPSCGNENTVSTSSFNFGGGHVYVTFVVPRGFYYLVTVDGGPITVALWTESSL